MEYEKNALVIVSENQRIRNGGGKVGEKLLKRAKRRFNRAQARIRNGKCAGQIDKCHKSNPDRGSCDRKKGAHC